jgi:hypothetical protein
VLRHSREGNGRGPRPRAEVLWQEGATIYGSTGIYGYSIQEHGCFVGGRFGRRLWQYLLSGVVNDWKYLEIYVDLLSRNKSSCKIYLKKIYIN